jgi:hypothetical protein
MAKSKSNERTKVSQGSRSRMSEPHPNRDRIGDRIVLLYDARLFLQHGGPRLDEVGRLWGTQGDAAWERLRVAANERTNESQSLWIGRLTEHYGHTLRTLSHETEGKGGKRVKPRQQGVD